MAFSLFSKAYQLFWVEDANRLEFICLNQKLFALTVKELNKNGAYH